MGAGETTLRAIFTFTFVCLALHCGGCERSAKFVGNWELETIDVNAKSSADATDVLGKFLASTVFITMDIKLHVDIADDGTYAAVGQYSVLGVPQSDGITGHWQSTGDRITFMSDGKNEATSYTLRDGKLVIETPEGARVILRHQPV